MRRSARRHELIMVAYEELQDERVRRGEIKPESRSVAVNHANRVFEACLRSLSTEALNAIVKVWFPGLGYTKVINQLKELIEERPRIAHRVKS